MKYSIFLLIMFQRIAFSQPDLSSRLDIKGLTIFKDFRKSNTYYILPPKLDLIIEKDGKPRLTLINSRYTGTTVYGDAGEKRFRNLLQFGISMENIDLQAIKAIKNQLGGSGINLLMMPINNVETIVMLPAAGAQKASKLGKNGSFTSSSNDESTFGFWKNRTYSVYLQNQEAELVSHLMEEGKLFLSFNYSYKCEVIRGTKAYKKITNPRQVFQSVQKNLEEVIKVDSTCIILPVLSNTFSINVDTQKWNLIRKIDINENVPPAYSVLEARCYDFTNELRPDLAMKIIDIEATGLNNTIISLPSIKFLSTSPSTNTISASFPFAVKLTKPLRYKVSEIKKNGEKIMFDWVSKDNWIEIIDITTPIDALKYKQQTFDFEISPEILSDTTFQSLEIEVAYFFIQKSQKISIEFQQTSSINTEKLTLIFDINTPPKYRIILNGKERRYESDYKILNVDFLMVNTKLLDSE
jgi:hypothetical protein